MPPQDTESIIDKEALAHYDACIDVVVSPEQTPLIQAMVDQKKTVIPGFKMALYQGVAQYELYTGLSAPMDLMEENMQRYLKGQ